MYGKDTINKGENTTYNRQIINIQNMLKKTLINL